MASLFTAQRNHLGGSERLSRRCSIPPRYFNAAHLLV